MLLKNENQNLSQVFSTFLNSLLIFSPAILDLDSNFPSTHYSPCISIYSLQSCARRVSCIVDSWVCMAGPNCLLVTTLMQPHIIYNTYMTHMQCWIKYSYYTTPSSVCSVGLSTFITQHQVLYATHTHYSM